MLAGLVVGGFGLSALADRWCRRALAITDQVGDPRDEGYILSRAACIDLGQCRWADAEAAMTRAERVASAVGDLRSCEESRTEQALLALYHGPLERGLEPIRSARALTARSRSSQSECWITTSEADLLLRLGQVAAAVTLYSEALAKLDERTMASESLWGYGGLALARLRAGDATGAHVAAERARGFIADGTLSAFWTLQGIASTAETLLLLWERGWRSPDVTPAMLGDQALAVCRGLQRYARHFRVGRPNALLWRGYHAWLSGRRRDARRRWRRAATLAERLGTPYEAGYALLQLGLRPGSSRAVAVGHLTRAEDIFRGYGSADLAAAARAALERAGAADAGG